MAATGLSFAVVARRSGVPVVLAVLEDLGEAEAMAARMASDGDDAHVAELPGSFELVGG
jgi:hypothetical protein